MSQAYLESYVNEPDVKSTSSGLLYKVIKKGSGKSPRASDTVVVHYEGKLSNGTVFDSSYKRGKPAKFPVNGVIRGWTEALCMMKKGSVWELCIPPELAYGAKGIPGVIPPNSVLVFKVELIKPRKSIFGF